jgi:hypothetical protein
MVVFANPVFVYAFSFLFTKEDAGSFAVKLVYMIFGFIAPLAMSFLQIFPNTEDTAKVLRWFLMLVPIYDLCHGFMMITQIDLTKIILQQQGDFHYGDTLTPYDSRVAGYDCLFLGLALPIYWCLIFCFEYKVFDYVMCRGRNAGEIVSDPA